MNEQQAIERLDRLVIEASASRLHQDAFWTIAAVYDHGPQWGYRTSSTVGDGVKFLRNVIDPDRDDIRVTLNVVHPHVTHIKALLNLRKIKYTHVPFGNGSSMQVSATVLDEIMPRHLDRINALKHYRAANRIRVTFGSGVIRRSLIKAAEPILSTLPDGSQRAIQSSQVSWAACFPWEFLRDPAARSVDWSEDEDVICHEKPRTVEWVKHHFGKTIKSESSLGQLLSFQDMLEVARGMSSPHIAETSKAPALIVRETYFRTGPGADSWDLLLITATDPYGSRDRQQHQVLYFGRSPFYGLPFHMLNYDVVDNSPWGRGVPHLIMNQQDVINVGWSWLLRVQQAGAGKWRYLAGSVERPSQAFNNRIDEPIEWRWVNGNQNTPAPDRTSPPQLSPANMQVLQMAPQWVQDALNFNAVQSGAASKRGESGQALEIRLAAADAPLEDKKVDDELEIKRLLYGTSVDTVDNAQLYTLRAIAGDDLPDELIRALKRQPARRLIAGVDFNTQSLRPKTQQQIEQRYTALAASQIIDADRARWEMMLEGSSPDSRMSAAYDKQMGEIERMVAGEPVRPAIAEAHQYHMWTIESFIDSNRFLSVPEEGQNLILGHYAAHAQAMQVRQASGLESSQRSPQGSPPSAATEAAVGMAPAGAGAGVGL